jgi:hypothetical protein
MAGVMLVETIDRGNEVEFTIAFLNRNGDPVTPVSATLTVNFLNAAGERSDQIIPLAPQVGDTWYGVWDSQVAQPARTYWTVRSENPDSAEDGFFVLSGNLANLYDVTTS